MGPNFGDPESGFRRDFLLDVGWASLIAYYMDSRSDTGGQSVLIYQHRHFPVR